MPTRNETPDVIEVPEMEFKVDRGALMGGFDSGFGSDAESTDESTDNEPEMAEQVADIEVTPIVPTLTPAEQSLVDEQAEAELVTESIDEPSTSPAADTPEPVQELVEERVEEPALQSTNDSAELAYMDPAPTPLETIENDPVTNSMDSSRTPGFQLIAVESVDPEYPRDAWLEKTEGWVELRLTIDSDGAVADASVLNAEPKRVFDRSAIRALRKSTFRAPSEFGLSGPQTATLRIEFDLGS